MITEGMSKLTPTPPHATPASWQRHAISCPPSKFRWKENCEHRTKVVQYSSLNRCAPSRCVRGVACRQLGRVAGHDAVTGRSGNPFWSPAAEVNAYLEFGAVLRRITPCGHGLAVGGLPFASAALDRPLEVRQIAYLCIHDFLDQGVHQPLESLRFVAERESDPRSASCGFKVEKPDRARRARDDFELDPETADCLD